MFKKQRGFTLIELLVVLGIVAMLASLVGPSVFKRLAPAKRDVAKAQIENFSSALDTFYVDNGRFPAANEGLNALVVKPASLNKWNGPYIKKGVPKDPWGNDYIYRVPGRMGSYEIISTGADGIEGGEKENADIDSFSNAD